MNHKYCHFILDRMQYAIYQYKDFVGTGFEYCQFSLLLPVYRHKWVPAWTSHIV